MFGHRLSEDFDWFLPGSFDPGKLLPFLEGFSEVAVAETWPGTFHGWIDGIRVSWLHYPNPLLEELIEAEDLPGLFLFLPVIRPDEVGLPFPTGAPARTLSICMNWAARGSLLRSSFPPRKFRTQLNLYHMIKSLSYFDDAEKDPWPVMLKETDGARLRDISCHPRQNSSKSALIRQGRNFPPKSAPWACNLSFRKPPQTIGPGMFGLFCEDEPADLGPALLTMHALMVKNISCIRISMRPGMGAVRRMPWSMCP